MPSPEPQPAAGDARLGRWLDAVSAVWLVLLPALRPLIWSGDPGDAANLGFLCLLAAAIASGLVRRAITGETLGCGRATALGAAVLAIAAVGALRSPYPASSWLLWWGWCLHLGAAVALAPAIRARPGLLLAGLLAGLAVEGAVLAGQVRWERPALLADLAGDPALVASDQREQFAVRAASWRLEGSFLLANSLAAYLITVLPLALGLAWSAWRERRGSRWALAALAALGTCTLVRSGSKMGMAALAVALAGAAVAALPARRRWLPVAAVAVLLATALAIPALRDRLAASAGVRLDYWRAGLRMLAEAPVLGHGLDGFRQAYPRLKAPAAEATIIAHNEPLQAAVDLGLPAALLMLAWWSLGLRAATRPAPVGDCREPPRRRRWAGLAAAALAAYAVATTGAIDGRFLHGPALAAWSAALAGLLALVAAGLDLPPLPRWCAPAGIAACLIHACADFHLHSLQVVGILALVAVLGTAVQPVVVAPARRAWLALALATVVAVVATTTLAARRHERLERAQLAADLLRRSVGAARRPVAEDISAAIQAGVAEALAGFGQPLAAVAPAPEHALARAALAELEPAALGWPGDPDLAAIATAIALHDAGLHPESAARLAPTIARFAVRWPGQVGFASAMADLEGIAGRAPGDEGSAHRLAARAWSATAVRLYPSMLPFRRRLAGAARACDDGATAAHEEAEIARLAPLVHPQER